MSKILTYITDNHLDPNRDNSTLLAELNDLDEIRLRTVLKRLNEVENKYGACYLLRITQPVGGDLSVLTDHEDAPGVHYDKTNFSIK